jgi:RAB protein geranylgeranyltransferase component A
LPGSSSLDDHFTALEMEDFDSVTYINHEGKIVHRIALLFNTNAGVPESFDDVVDYFRSTTLFKQHHFSIPLTAETEKCLGYWRGRTKHHQVSNSVILLQ